MKSGYSKFISVVALAAALAYAAPLVAQRAANGAGQGAPRKLQHYSVTVLSTLGGTFANAWVVNNGGLIVGHSTIAGDQEFHASIWRKGKIADLGTLSSGPLSRADALNAKGTAAGMSNTSTPDPNGEDFCGWGTNLICLPFVWQKGVMNALPLLGGNNGFLGGINNRDQMVGVSETSNFDSCSFAFLQVEPVIWDHGTVQALPPYPGDSDGNATAINDNGQAVGATGCTATNIVRAVLWPAGPNGEVIDLGNLGGTAFNIAFAVNNRAQVVGQSTLAGNTSGHAFLWQNGVMTDLGSLPELPNSVANAINNQGQVVGDSQDANGDDSSAIAWIWQNGVMTDLNTLIPSDSSLFLMEALSINDRGQIAGFGSLSDGEVLGFLLTPCNKRCN